jgi:hypothetical protein
MGFNMVMPLSPRSPAPWEPSNAVCMEAVMAVIQSERFAKRPREASLLYYIAENTIRGEEITAKAIACDIFELDVETYLLTGNPIVRVTLNHLRKALSEYHENGVSAGTADPITVTIETSENTYKAHFEFSRDRFRSETGRTETFPIKNGVPTLPFTRIVRRSPAF